MRKEEYSTHPARSRLYRRLYARGIIADKIHAVAERFDKTLFARLALETADEILQTAHLILVILHDDYPHNIYPLRMITRYN